VQQSKADISLIEAYTEMSLSFFSCQIEDLLQTGFSISAEVGGQQLRGFLYTNNPKFVTIAQSLALKKKADDQQAARIAAEVRGAPALLCLVCLACSRWIAQRASAKCHNRAAGLVLKRWLESGKQPAWQQTCHSAFDYSAGLAWY
jgi:hypothetical protein